MPSKLLKKSASVAAIMERESEKAWVESIKATWIVRVELDGDMCNSCRYDVKALCGSGGSSEVRDREIFVWMEYVFFKYAANTFAAWWREDA